MRVCFFIGLSVVVSAGDSLSSRSSILGWATPFSPSSFHNRVSQHSQKLRPCALDTILTRRCRPQNAFLRLAASAEGEGGSSTKDSIVDKVASKGIWQFGALPDDAKDALAKSGWIEKEGEDAQEGEEGSPVATFEREDIDIIVQRAVADETFADDRSKEMYIEDTREKLLKEILRREIRAEQGVELEDLLNPIKVLELEKKILKAEAALSLASGEEQVRLTQDLEGKREELAREKRAVMRDWLKTLFRGQALLSLLIGGALSFNAVPFVDDVPIAARALGFWTLWLFTIPSLRAVKPLGYPDVGLSAEAEKKALNLAFVATPLLTLLLPVFTKNPGLIFSADAALLAACYAYYKALPPAAAAAGSNLEITGVLKYLDYGTGRERGARK